MRQHQRPHWPGLDTHARLAAIGLEIVFLPGSKLTKEVIYKGPKNLQIQQCKRILLELELGLITLRETTVVPRPSRPTGISRKHRRVDSESNNRIDGSAVGSDGQVAHHDPSLFSNQQLVTQYLQNVTLSTHLLDRDLEQYAGGSSTEDDDDEAERRE